MSLAGLGLGELAFTFGLFGGAMVLLYLLRVRRRTVVVPFSPLWARVMAETRSSALFRRLQRPWSLLLQLLLVALIVLALGDPRTDGVAGAGCRHVATAPPPAADTLLLIDTSASMHALESGRTRLEAATLEARRRADALLKDPANRVMIASFDVRAQPLTPWTMDPAPVRAALQRLLEDPPREVGTDFANGLAFAAAATAEAARPTTLVFSDFAAPIPPDAPAFEPVVIGTDARSAGIAAFNVRPLPDDPLTYVAWYAVRNDLERAVTGHLHIHANPEGSGAEDFERGARIVASIPLSLGAGETVTGQRQDLKFEGDRLMARWVLAPEFRGDDALELDNRAFAVVPERRRLDVLLVTAGNTFLKAALSLRENVSLTEMSPAAWAAAAPGRHDVIVLDGVPRRAGEAGRFLHIAPPDLETSGTEADVETSRVEARHPLLRGVRVVDWAISELPIHTTLRSDTVVVASAKRSPVLWTRGGPGDAERWVVIPFDLKRSLLPMNVAFPLLVVNALNFLADEPEGVLLPLSTAEAHGLPVPFDAAALAVEGPGGPIADVQLLAGRARLDLGHAGIYTVTGTPLPDGRGGGRHAVAVNLADPAESALAPQLEAPAPAAEPERKPQADATADAAPLETPVWRLLLLFAFALLVIEQLTWHRRWTT